MLLTKSEVYCVISFLLSRYVCCGCLLNILNKAQNGVIEDKRKAFISVIPSHILSLTMRRPISFFRSYSDLYDMFMRLYA